MVGHLPSHCLNDARETGGGVRPCAAATYPARFSLSLSISLSHTHTQTRSHTHTLSLSFSLPLSHIHTLTYTHTHTHTHTHCLNVARETGGGVRPCAAAAYPARFVHPESRTHESSPIGKPKSSPIGTPKSSGSPSLSHPAAPQYQKQTPQCPCAAYCPRGVRGGWAFSYERGRCRVPCELPLQAQATQKCVYSAKKNTRFTSTRIFYPKSTG